MSEDEKKYFGGVLVDDLEDMAKSHPRSALSMAYGQGLVVGINRAKKTMHTELTKQRDELLEILKQKDEALALIAEYQVFEVEMAETAQKALELKPSWSE